MAANLGEVVERQVAITDAAGTLVNADSAPSWAVTLPDGTAGASPAVNNLSTGVYYVRYTTVQAGNHGDVWTATVGGQLAKFSGSFRVRQNVAPLLPLDEVRDMLGLGRDPVRDEQLLAVIDAAAAKIERRTGRLYRLRSITDVFSEPTTRMVLRSRPVVSVTSVTDDGVLQSASGYQLDPFGGVVWSLCGWWFGPVTVTYQAGVGEVPDDVLECAREVVRILWAQRSGATGTPRRTTGFDGPGRTVEAALAALADQAPVVA